jgi:S-adenosylmethionine-diacylgycerolhomoserine-N-methlytransferase
MMGVMNHAEAMDRIYHFQRHFYDATRKLFLFGRDPLLAGMDIVDGDRVLEMGCGTARNLLCLAKKHPSAMFYGLDASEEMLEIAQRKIVSADCADRIHVEKAYAEDLHHKKIFGLEIGFDKIFFSYSLSMMPAWKEALSAAFANLNPNGGLFVVDFYNQANWPGPIRAAMVKWLSFFHVRFHPEMIEELTRQFALHSLKVEVSSILSGYAFLARPSKLKRPFVSAR